MTNEKVGVRKNYSYFFYYNKINNLQLKTRITKLLGIEYPIIQGGMIWASQWQLATAVSNAGGLGLLGSGSMSAEELRTQIRQCKIHTDKPFGVNYKQMEQPLKISKTKVIRLYKIKSSFFNALVDNGLIKTEVIDRVTYVHYDQLPALERFVNWHYDLEINVPSIQIIHRLLERIRVLQEENQKLRRK